MNFQVKYFMTTAIKSVPPDMNAREALKILTTEGVSGLPVVDKDGVLLGVFTEKEVLTAIMPVYVKDVGTFVYGEDPKAILKKIAGFDKLTVRELMRKEVPTLAEDASLTEASRIMLTLSQRRIVVVKDKKVIGVITRCDVMKALAKAAGVAF